MQISLSDSSCILDVFCKPAVFGQNKIWHQNIHKILHFNTKISTFFGEPALSSAQNSPTVKRGLPRRFDF